MNSPRIGPSAQPSKTAELLRGLLPRYYWLRDAQAGQGTLEALIAALADEYEQLRGDVAALYDDLFIETCAPEIIPYIGAGVGVLGLGPVAGPGVGNRAWVGRALALRRKKGTLRSVTSAVSAATGWAAFAQAGLSTTAHTQTMRYPAPDHGRLLFLPDTKPLHDVDAPWSSLTRGVSISGRPLTAGLPAPSQPQPPAGYPTPTRIELAIWRLQSFRVTQRTPRVLTRPETHHGTPYAMHPAGVDMQLFAVPADRDPGETPSLKRLPLPLTIHALERALAEARSPFDPPVTVWTAELGKRLEPLPPNSLAAGDLSHWDARHVSGAKAIVDPKLGRLLVLHDPEHVAVDYAYGFSGDLGGGPYGHPGSYTTVSADTRIHQVSASELARALGAATSEPDSLILINDSGTAGTSRSVWEIELEHSHRLRIASIPQAAPSVSGRLRIRLGPGSRLELSGLTILDPIELSGPGELAVEHSTLAPSPESSVVAHERSAPSLKLSYTIAGSLDTGQRAQLSAQSAIIDGQGGAAIGREGRPAGAVDLRAVTILGSTTAGTVVAEDCIFTERLTSLAPDRGLLRFCYLPGRSRHNVLLGCVHEGDRYSELRPRFTSTRWGDPAYGQLDLTCPPEIARGASGSGEMGAFNWLTQPTRFARVALAVQEMLPVGIGARIDYRN